MLRNYLLGFLVFLTAAECVAETPKKLIWTETHDEGIRRANLDGSDVEMIVPYPIGAPYAIATNILTNEIYWTEIGGTTIRKANPDGSNAVDVITSHVTTLSELAIDAVGGKIYWTATTGDLRRANLDGSNSEVIENNFGDVAGLAIDSVHGKIYWTDPQALTNDRVGRSNLDGTDREESLLTGGIQRIGGIALDVAAGKMYFSDYSDGEDAIYRANLDGTGREPFLTETNAGLTAPNQIALDLDAGRIYWSESSVTTGLIRRANLDGTGVENVYHGENPLGLVIVSIPESPSILLAICALCASATTWRGRTRPGARLA